MDAKKFWTLSLTYGLPMTLLGAIIAIYLILTGHKPKRYHCLIYFELGKGWGGFNCGAFFFVNKNASKHLLEHEAGHGIQNINYGLITPFIVMIPSVTRYWYREYLVKHKNVSRGSLPKYEEIWFEKQATELGKKYFPYESRNK